METLIEVREGKWVEKCRKLREPARIDAKSSYARTESTLVVLRLSTSFSFSYLVELITTFE